MFLSRFLYKISSQIMIFYDLTIYCCMFLSLGYVTKVIDYNTVCIITLIVIKSAVV